MNALTEMLMRQLGGSAISQISGKIGADPDVMGMLGNLLDSNKDGSVLDDVGRIAGKLFGR